MNRRIGRESDDGSDHANGPRIVTKRDLGYGQGYLKLAPSILSADFARLGEQVAEAEQAGADRIHVDVMDGHFVPNISMGAPIVKSLRRVTRLPLGDSPDDLGSGLIPGRVCRGRLRFVSRPLGRQQQFASHSATHQDAAESASGVAINPATPAAVLEEILQDVDQVLVMTVNPGFGHQHFIHTTLPKIRRVRQMIEQIKPGCDLEVDGGIDADNCAAGRCRRSERSGGRIGDF